MIRLFRKPKLNIFIVEEYREREKSFHVASVQRSTEPEGNMAIKRQAFSPFRKVREKTTNQPATTNKAIFQK